MSFDAIKWAMEQPVGKASTKFVLVAMANCVNGDGADMLCWPSYAYLARTTHHDIKTVEAAIYRLKETGLIVDTGARRGETGKVVVYHLNAPKTGCIQPGPQTPESGDVQGANNPEKGGIAEGCNPPNFPGNPPKTPSQSPQISGSIPPKTGGRTSNGIRKGTKKESEAEAAAVTGVDPKLLGDWLAVRKDKKAGTLTETAVEGLFREASKAGLTASEAVRYCIDANWIGFNAGFYAKREGQAAGHAPRLAPNKHSLAARTIFGPQPTDYIDVETN